MKKIISFMLIIAITLSLCVGVLGASGESDEVSHVLSLVKERIGETEEYDEFISSVSENGGVKRYTFRWSSSEKNLNVTASESGVILSYNKYDNSKPHEKLKPTINKMSQGEALGHARELIGKINPDIISDLRLTTDTYDSLFDEGFSFRIQRLYHGVDVVGDTGYIRVNKDASQIESFNLNFTENVKFDELSESIERDAAIAGFKGKLGMVLSYKLDKDKANLQYSLKEPGKYISAITGEVVKPIKPEYAFYKNEAAMDSAMMGSAGGGSQFTEAELKNLEVMNTLLSRADAEALIKNNEILKIPSEATVSYFNTNYNDFLKKYFYGIEFFHKDFSAYACIDAKDGELITFNRYDKYEKEEYKENLSLARKLTETLSPKHYKADDSKKFRFEKVEGNTYTFLRYENDIPCFDNRIYITLNNKGDVLSYNISFTEAEFESPEGVLSHDAACDSMIAQCGYGLYYIPACSEEGMKTCDIGILVYDTTNKNTTIDAQTGKNYTHSEEEGFIGIYEDIEGHYAEEIINVLGAYGIGFEGKKFEPDKIITQEEYAALLVSALTYGEGINLNKADKIISRYTTAVRDGLVTEAEKDEKAPVTRGFAAVMMIRALGFEEVASLEGIYLSEFTDVKENIGYISILKGMGVVNGFDGKFNPERNITRADAMSMIYNYLSK